MAATNFTPISLYYSTTASTAPTAGNLVAGELAINTNDGVLYYKDSSGVVQSIASKAGNSGSFTNLAYTGTLTGGTGVVNLGSGQFYKDASGNVGIGTSSPSSLSLLQVRKDQNAATSVYITNATNGASSTATLGLSNDAVVSGLIMSSTAGGSYLSLNNAASGPLLLATSNTERMRINSSGNLLIGTTSATPGNNNGVIINQGTGTTTFSHDTNQLTGYYYCGFTYGGNTYIGSIAQVGTTAVIYNTTSDYRLKTIIGSISDSGQRIDALNPIEYDWKVGGRTRGFLAHEFAEIYPNSVSGEKDAVDAEGKPKYQGMQASTPEVMADLIAEIQSLRKRVATLEAK